MTAPHYRELGPRRRRRLLLHSLVRSSLSTATLVTVYYLAPLDSPRDAVPLVLLVLGLAVFAGLMAWQLRAIARAPYPRLRAVEALSMALPLLLVLFAAAYILIEQNAPGAFSEPLNHTDALYFTVTVFATVGFGDIVPVTATARLVTTVQMVIDLLAIGVIAKVILGAVETGLRRRESGRPDEPDALS
ncbi:potassium channel family protein [Actinacidiphila soli]|uniref:potassium channel family protein n=1 Tax=Actinacidiphila soli TaxID=2487275 RepID=UPI000FCB9CF3|nr:potassium channel family protein [Actinacidiphila soli]